MNIFIKFLQHLWYSSGPGLASQMAQWHLCWPICKAGWPHCEQYPR